MAFDRVSRIGVNYGVGERFLPQESIFWPLGDHSGPSTTTASPIATRPGATVEP